MKKKLMSALLASVLCVSMVLPASAAEYGGVYPVPDGTDIYAGVIVDVPTNPDDAPKIRVTVPTLFAFVVNGTKDTTSTAALSVTDGTILIPNYMVEVADETTNSGNYKLANIGESTFKVSNYSTKGGATGTGLSGREGIPVTLKGYIENKGSSASRNYWEHVAVAPTNDKAAYKKYLVTLYETMNPTAKYSFTDADGGKFYMDNEIKIDAPAATAEGTIDSNGLATAPATKDIGFDVQVGGQRGQYKQVEKSAKVGTIVWTAYYQIANSSGSGIETAPKNGYSYYDDVTGDIVNGPEN